MNRSPTVSYFGKQIVEAAIADWIINRGINASTRDQLLTIAAENEDDFFQIVCDFVENKS